jgi:hypothetical protein
MGKYALTLKGNSEIIHKHISHSLMLAVHYFAAVKNLSESKLMDIYDVKKIK